MDDEFDHFLGKPSEISEQMTRLNTSQVSAARAVPASARLIYNQLSDVAMVCEYDAVVVRGLLGKEAYSVHSYVTSCCRSCLYVSYGSYICPLSNGV